MEPMDLILAKLDKLEVKLDKLVDSENRNSADISWLKSSGKVSLGFVLSILTGIVVTLVRNILT